MTQETVHQIHPLFAVWSKVIESQDPKTVGNWLVQKPTEQELELREERRDEYESLCEEAGEAYDQIIDAEKEVERKKEHEEYLAQLPDFQIASMGQENWLYVLKALSVVVEEGTIEVTNEEVVARTMDPSHVCMIDIRIPRACFWRYEIDKPGRFGLRLDEVEKVMKRMPKEKEGGEITISLDKSNERAMFYLRTMDPYRKEYRLHTIEPATGSTPLPKIGFNAKVSMLRKTLINALEDLAVTSNYVTFEATSDRFLLIGRGDSGEINLAFESGSEGFEELNVRDESKATFGIEFLLPMLKAVNEKSVTLEYSTKMPLRLEFPAFKEGKIHFFLAPRVE